MLSVGYTYDNRRLAEGYNSPGSPYWSTTAFTALAASDDHGFWRVEEEPLAPLDRPVTIVDPGWVVSRDHDHAVALVARADSGFGFPEQAPAKYRKFAYSSVFGFSGDCADGFGRVATDSTLAPHRR